MTFNIPATLRQWRPEISTTMLALVMTLFSAVACNTAFWSKLAALPGVSAASSLGFMAAMFVLLCALQFIVFSLLINRWTAKPILTLLIVATAFAAYYMRQYHVYLDPSMLRNVLRTDVKEARGEIVKVIRTLEDSGDIVINRGTDEVVD